MVACTSNYIAESSQDWSRVATSEATDEEDGVLAACASVQRWWCTCSEEDVHHALCSDMAAQAVIESC